ncbi:TetR/AcrR family transcriptional regulator C-terminal domain-containing protein [Actinokineospora soli]|uniref:TetR/AcrR family transcriptional regulator C-terminal domain-containing protein n=1 Tax=Actinokineospora soli TaxID=1048753 RepID=A0ABW2TNQ2_9PSEU
MDLAPVPRPGPDAVHGHRAARPARRGLRPGPLDSAYHTIENHIVGHALQAIGFPLAEEDLEQAGKDFLATFPTAEFPDLAAHIRHHIDHPTQGDGFEFGLDLILDGLEELRTAP